MAHSRKRIRKLSTAVFRGTKTEFSFDVYPISPDITDYAAVFIFSRRTVDKFGRWHHVVSCLGETASIVSEIKKHRRSKCVKSNHANVVCLIKEPDRSVRKSALDDIVAARLFSCVRGVFKSDVKARSAGKRPRTTKILAQTKRIASARVKRKPTTRCAKLKTHNGSRSRTKLAA